MTLNQHAIQLIANGTMDAEQLSLLIKADLLDPAAGLDWIQMTRVCATLNDAQEIVLKGTEEGRKQAKEAGEPAGVNDYAVRQARAMYPELTAENKQFKHIGNWYKAENRGAYIFKDEKGNQLTGPLFDKLARLDARKQKLADKQKEVTRDRNKVMDQILKKYHPNREEAWIFQVIRK